jgi:hypothetical protein
MVLSGSPVAKVMPYKGVLKNMAVYVQDNGTSITTITAYKNGVATSLEVIVLYSATGNFYDNAHTEQFNKGDRLDTKVNTGQGEWGIILSVSYEYEEA